ncbi:hypothetical protein QYE76_063610 [Lolium multiflorum]|uniref:Transposase-associated domain-containing protein n=1 Tax=Lolium multiflorum TaxID=4521 RepID=A0AAD8S610_LOLMU|nr:hypothetical protein QYE76_063610 [Lolium multiflorum]
MSVAAAMEQASGQGAAAEGKDPHASVACRSVSAAMEQAVGRGGQRWTWRRGGRIWRRDGRATCRCGLVGLGRLARRVSASSLMDPEKLVKMLIAYCDPSEENEPITEDSIDVQADNNTKEAGDSYLCNPIPENEHVGIDEEKMYFENEKDKANVKEHESEDESEDGSKDESEDGNEDESEEDLELEEELREPDHVPNTEFHVVAGIPGVAPHYSPPPTTFTWHSSPIGLNFSSRNLLDSAAGGTFMSITLGAATKLLDDMMINYSEWHTERTLRSHVDPNNVPLASLVAQEEHVDVNFIKNNNFNNNAYRNNYGNNKYSPYPSNSGNGYEKLGKIDVLASKVDSLALDVDLLKLKVMPDEVKDTKFAKTNAIQGYSSSREVHLHLIRHGFMPSYNCWTKHGERGVIMEEDEEGDDIDESYLDHFGDTFMDDAEGGEGEGEGDQEEARDEPVDDLGRTIADARSRCETEKERENLDRMLEDHRKALYPGCDDGLKKLGCTLDLLKWKAQAGVADSAFENLLKMLKNMFPKNNELPASTYEAKKVVCPLGLEVLKIHACINDCILYRGEYENVLAR